MISIIVKCEGSRMGLGRLEVNDDLGNTILGPWPVACGVTAHSNEEGPISDFSVIDIVPLNGNSIEDYLCFGRYGIVRMHQETGNDTSRWSPEDLYYIYGGALSPNGDLMLPPPRCFRLRPEHHRVLVMEINKTPLPIRCSWREGEPPLLSQSTTVPIVSPSSFSLVSSRIATLAELSATAAAPFILLSNTVEAQYCSSGNSYSAVDFSQLAALEGGNKYVGHVPDDESGVNIAAGFDLGARTRQDLIDMGFGDEKIRQFHPYLAKSRYETVKGARARDILSLDPLTISPEQAEEINRLVFSWHANIIGSEFNHAIERHGTLHGFRFSDLPSQFQTAMTNMFLVDKQFTSSDAFEAFANGQWTLGVNALMDYRNAKLAVVARAKAAAVGLHEVAERISLQFG